MKKVLILFSAICFTLIACEGDSNDLSPDTSGSGTSGSLAAFTIVGNHLYSILNNTLATYALETNGELRLVNKLELLDGLETIFPYGDNLLIGSQNGVYFMDLSQPTNPILISSYEHVTSCDPVVARNGVAYSTLRSTGCNFARGGDVLDVIDISDLSSPRLIRSYTSSEPYGLAVTANFLFVCEKGGISVIDNSDPSDLQYLNLFLIDGAVPKDIIVSNGHLVVTTDIGIYNVSHSDTGDMHILGRLTSE